MNALDIDDCKAEEHSCICNTRKDIIEKCRGDNHDMLLR
jgi:hypothetical protein